MSEKLFKKTRLLLMVVAISLVTMAVLLSGVQDDLSRKSYRTEIEQEIKELPGLLEAAEDESAENAENAEQFDAIYQSKADQLAFIAQNNVGFEATDAKMVEYQKLLEVATSWSSTRRERSLRRPSNPMPTSPAHASTCCARPSAPTSRPRRWRLNFPSRSGTSATTRAASTTRPWPSSSRAPMSSQSLSPQPAHPRACCATSPSGSTAM